VGWDKAVIIGYYKYEIDDNNEVRVWDLKNPNEFDAPFLYQPTWPDNTPWQSRQAAEQWVIAEINNLLTPPVVEEVVEPIVE